MNGCDIIILPATPKQTASKISIFDHSQIIFQRLIIPTIPMLSILFIESTLLQQEHSLMHITLTGKSLTLSMLQEHLHQSPWHKFTLYSYIYFIICYILRSE